MPSLYRESDGAGDSGPLSELTLCKLNNVGQYEIARDSEGNPIREYGKPKLHCLVKVGSIVARSYQMQDWWQTTPVTEILEDTGNTVKFRTNSGSIYVWKE